ncbi:hypothetical protein MCHUDSM44219_05652 [Mycolicibacterium chubuense]|uniref:Uncharacterized protein n=1 Tax=Mycolicibacterium chubuense TaxID=1800 RepID=A0A0J6VC37_MYCCU|nr:hypothetical protein MCHUDSM44219_05652 [Mycolicibacterium chubuense]
MSSALLLATSWAIWSLRLASTVVTVLASASRWRSWASRALRVSENWATLRRASLSCGGVSANVSASVVSDWESWLVSSALMVVVRSPRAVGRSYGEVVRSNGMAPESVPSPRGVSSSILVPRTVSVLIAASVRSPRSTVSPTVKSTRTVVPSRATSDTRPTLMPDTRTSLPALMPPASVKNAE